MTDDSDDDLQFDQAEFGNKGEPESRVACKSCGQGLGKEYFVVNDQVVCTPCQQTLGAIGNEGTAFGRFTKATAIGLLGGAIGAGIYFGIVKLTGYEIGLVAIVVGWLVGAGVRFGAAGRGGWAYQSLAIVITYAAIVITYVPLVMQGFDANYGPQLDTAAPNVAKIVITRQKTILLNDYSVSLAELDSELQRIGGETMTTGEINAAMMPAGVGEAWYYREGMASEPSDETAEQVANVIYQNDFNMVPFKDSQFQQPELWTETIARGGGGRQLAAAITLFAVAAAAPFLMLPENIIGLLIIAFALFQAWQMNKRVALDIKGPFQISELSR